MSRAPDEESIAIKMSGFGRLEPGDVEPPRVGTPQVVAGAPASGELDPLIRVTLALFVIGLGVWLLLAGGAYRREYSGTGVAWHRGAQNFIEITLVREDQVNLACAADATMQGLHCGLGADRRPLQSSLQSSTASDGDDAHLLRPYSTVNGEVFLGAGLWNSLAATRTPAGRTIYGDLRLRHCRPAPLGGIPLDAQRQLRGTRAQPRRGRAPRLRDPAMSVRQRAQSIAAVLANAVEQWRRSWHALSRVERATTVVLSIMIVAGVVLRVRDIAFPPRFTFDEHHFVPNARRYLLGEADDNDHPPLGKLLIAVGLLMFGDNPTGWRAASLIFGLQSLVVAAALARALFANRRAGWFAAAFFAGDGFFLAYSRTALLDGGLTCLVLWSLLAAVTARTWRGVLACALLVGLAASVKWSGGMAVVPAVVAILVLRRAPRWSLLLFAAAPILHVALWLGTFPLSGRPADPRALLTLLHELLRRHIEIGRLQNPLASPWYTWPVLYHPIVVKLADHGTGRRYASSVGNPLLFFSSTIAILATLLAGVVASRERGGPICRSRARRWSCVPRRC